MYPTQKIKMPKDLAGHKNGQLPDELLGPVPGGKLHKTAVRSYKHMLNAAKAAGVELKPTSSVDTYRPYKIQYDAFMQRYSPKPTDDTRGITRTFQGDTWYLKKGYAPCAAPDPTGVKGSNHGWGLAVDFANASGKTFTWLTRNANRFGWYIGTGDPASAGFESWHWEYVLGNVWEPPTETVTP
jgi:LAS superfamily LD-carboxypeptidase LdcB